MKKNYNPTLFINTGWMDFYNGIKNDNIKGGGKYVKEQGWGGEIFNFKTWKDMVYGYGQPKIDKKHGNPTQIKIEKLGADLEDESISNVNVIWTATNPITGGTFIVGWYKKATVYRYYQSSASGSNRRYKNDTVGFFVSAKAKFAKLLPVDERRIQIKRQTPGWMGQSNIWYADKQPEFVSSIISYIENGTIPKEVIKKEKANRGFYQSDPLRKVEVEKCAIKEVVKHYNKLGFTVFSVEKDNVGWDLVAQRDKTKLKLEVKGLSGNEFYTELTPNEYQKLNDDKINYRICIVTNALQKPNLTVFYYSNETSSWTSDDGISIGLKEIKSARIIPLAKN